MLANKKLFVSKKAKEVLDKLEKLGYKRTDTNFYHNEMYPFIFIHKDRNFTQLWDLKAFNNCDYEEITTEEILSLEAPKPKKTLADLMPITGFGVRESGELVEYKNKSQH